MPTAGSMLVNIRKIFGDVGAAFIDDLSGLTWLDQAQQDFCNDVWMLEEIKNYAINKQWRHFQLPTMCIIPMSVMWMQTKYIKLEPEPPNVWDQLTEAYPLSSGNPYHYTVIRRTNDYQELLIGPQFPAASSTQGLIGSEGALATTATTIPLVSGVTGWRSRGWAIIGSAAETHPEVIEYNTTDNLPNGAGTGDLLFCLRGQHDTYASNVLTFTPITQVDLQVRYKRMPSALATNTTPEIPEGFHRYLETYALYLAKLAHGEPKEADGYLEIYMKQKEIARKMAGRRQSDGLMRIKPRRLGSLYPPV
jgi:hypothetical protein